MAAAVTGVLAAAPAASATIASIPANENGSGTIACTVQAAPNEGERWCSGIFTTFDGAPIDINVGFPPAPATGLDGNFPIVGVFHGWGGSKFSLGSTGRDGLQQWLDNGYAVFSMSDRGWGNSCGATDPKRPTPACVQHGYNHLMDTRYEVRDAQELFEVLADQPATGASSGEGLIDPQKIAATGGSYGGGISMALGALRNRKMVGGQSTQPIDGTLEPWQSNGGKAMQIAAVQPDIPWTDLAYSLQPNGATLDYVADAPYLGPNGDRRIGVLKQSFVAGLYGLGSAGSFYAPPGSDPDADLTRWYAQVNSGEPYDENPLAADIVAELTRHHSSYYIDHSIPPAPMLISNGWTDDLFPPDEAIRFYNRTRTEHPETPISLFFSDHGHQRGQNKAPDADYRTAQRRAWFDHYVKGEGPVPFQGVQTLTQTCPKAAPSGGASGDFDDPAVDIPFRAPSWAALAPGEVRFESPGERTIVPGPSDSASQTYDPIAGGGACATANEPPEDPPNVTSYSLEPAPAGGYTLMGSATVIAGIEAGSPTSQVAARLVDVAPDGKQTLIARALYRPTDDAQQVFQLHPNGWHFAEGHVAKLQLLTADEPYGRVSNGQAPVTVSDLELRLPVLEAPGTGPVQAPAPKVLPPGYALAIDYRTDDGGGGGAGGSGGGGAGGGGGGTGGGGVAACALTADRGSAKNDKLNGTTGPDHLVGGRGNDRLRTGAGDDCAAGNQGRDRLSGASGDDELRGGAGNDKIRGGAGADVIDCGSGRRDFARAGGADTVRRCERVKR